MVKIGETPVVIDLIDAIGALHGGQAILLAVIVSGKKHEAVYWVHPAQSAVLTLDDELETTLSAKEGSEAYNTLLEAVAKLYPQQRLLELE